MTGWVLRNSDTREYVAVRGFEHSYTRSLEHAQVFLTEEEARKDCCQNEIPVKIDSLLSGFQRRR